MSITGLITSVFMLIAPAEEVNIAGQIYKGVILTDKVIQKTEEGSWGASAHEEGYQITKDSILKLGGLKLGLLAIILDISKAFFPNSSLLFLSFINSLTAIKARSIFLAIIFLYWILQILMYQTQIQILFLLSNIKVIIRF